VRFAYGKTSNLSIGANKERPTCASYRHQSELNLAFYADGVGLKKLLQWLLSVSATPPALEPRALSINSRRALG
jgi:hypothetical protein